MGQRTDSKINRAFRIAIQYGHDLGNDLAEIAGISKHEAGRIGAGKSVLPETSHMGNVREAIEAIVDYVSPPTSRALIAALD